MHWDTEGAVAEALDYRVGEASGFRSEQQTVPFPVTRLVVQTVAARRKAEQTCFVSCVKELFEIPAESDLGPLMIVEAGASETTVAELKSQWFDKCQRGARVGSESYDITGVWGYLWLIQDDVEHGITFAYREDLLN